MLHNPWAFQTPQYSDPQYFLTPNISYRDRNFEVCAKDRSPGDTCRRALKRLPESPPIRDVWIADPKNVYAAGDRGTLLHHNGISWSVVDLGRHPLTSYQLTRVWGMNADEVYVIGNRQREPDTEYDDDSDAAVMVHFDGRIWSVQEAPKQHFFDGWSRDSKHVFVLQTHRLSEDADRSLIYFNGSTWSTLPINTGLFGGILQSVGGDNHHVFVGGQGGAIFRAPFEIDDLK